MDLFFLLCAVIGDVSFRDVPENAKADLVRGHRTCPVIKFKYLKGKSISPNELEITSSIF